MKKEEGSPNFKKYVGGALGQIASMAGIAGMGALAKKSADKELTSENLSLAKKLVEASLFPVHRNHKGLINGSAFLTEPVKEWASGVHVGHGAASVLGHELGHGDISNSPVGRLFQNKATILMGRHAGVAGALGGFVSGLATDDPRIQKAAILAPLIASLPTLGFEAAASVGALQKLRMGGASEGQLLQAAKTLSALWGTYALRVAGETAGAYAAQAGGRALRNKLKEHGEKEKKAMDDVTMKAFADELHKIGGFLDAAKNILTTPIPGTPDLLGGVKSSIEKATRGGMPGKGGPSAGFQKFQQQQRAAAAAMPKHASGTLGPQGINAAVRAGGLGLTRKNVLGAMMHPGVSPDMVSSIHRAAMTPSAAGPLNEAFAGHVKSMFQAGAR